jgi:hypothetical protein
VTGTEGLLRKTDDSVVRGQGSLRVQFALPTRVGFWRCNDRPPANRVAPYR